jgi:prephenate dehydrogenase
MNVLRLIERHLEASGMSYTRFGRMVAKDPRLVHDMRRGRQPNPPMIAKIRAFIAQAEGDRP